jgi:hypothetical protein
MKALDDVNVSAYFSLETYLELIADSVQACLKYFAAILIEGRG